MSTVEDMGNVVAFMIRTGLIAGSFMSRSPPVLKKDIDIYLGFYIEEYYVWGTIFRLLCYPMPYDSGLLDWAHLIASASRCVYHFL